MVSSQVGCISECHILYSGVGSFYDSGQFAVRVGGGDPRGGGLDLWEGLFWSHIIKTIPSRITLLLYFAWPASALPDDFFRFDT